MSEFIPGFHVVTMVSNSARYASRYRLYREFADRMEAAGVKLWTAEVAFGDRPFEVTDPNNFHHLQLRSENELWLKERALNLVIQRVTEQYPDWKYVAWIDADLDWLGQAVYGGLSHVSGEPLTGVRQWLKETWHALQQCHWVQMFQNAVDMGPRGEIIQTHTGFAYSYRHGEKFRPGYTGWHPGYAWACTRFAYESVGGLIDWAILGAGDHHMAGALTGQVEKTANIALSEPYIRKLLEWQALAERYTRRDIGYVPGTIRHFWHGRKKDRRYWDRWKIITECQFDPDKDIRNDAYGLLQIIDHGDMRSIQLRDRVRDYFYMRHEDSQDLE
jgi:hypothetical protein